MAKQPHGWAADIVEWQNNSKVGATDIVEWQNNPMGGAADIVEWQNNSTVIITKTNSSKTAKTRKTRGT